MSGPPKFAVLVGPGGLSGWRIDVIEKLCDVMSLSVVIHDRSDTGMSLRFWWPSKAGADALESGVVWTDSDVARRGASLISEQAACDEALQSCDLALDLRMSTEPMTHLPTWRFRFGSERSGDASFSVAEAVDARANTWKVALELSDGIALRTGSFALESFASRKCAIDARSSFTSWPRQVVTVLGTNAAQQVGNSPIGEIETTTKRRSGRAGAAIAAAGAFSRRALTSEAWTIAIAQDDMDAVMQRRGLGSTESVGFRPTRGPQRIYRRPVSGADPFLLHEAGKTRCLFELIEHGRPGRIAEITVPASPATLDPQPVFSSQWHWSYPQVFSDRGVTYCRPETADADGAILHEVTPDGMREVATLLPGLAVIDPTLLFFDDRYWLFCGLRRGRLVNTELHLFMADSITGRYHPHPENPVKIDVGSARPAGPFFTHKGSLFRPSQDCRGTYGAALVINEVDEINQHRYREHEVLRLVPPAPYTGMHTISAAGGWIAVDLKREFVSPFDVLARLRRGAQAARR